MSVPARRRHLKLIVLCVVLVMAFASRAEAAGEERTLQRYAEGTWASFVAMTNEQSGLPADTLKADGTRSVQTSTTNIGAYMWSAGGPGDDALSGGPGNDRQEGGASVDHHEDGEGTNRCPDASGPDTNNVCG